MTNLNPPRSCKNCHSLRRTVAVKGYCSKCYRYVHLIELSSKWNLNDPTSLKGFPSTSLLRQPPYFQKVKTRVPIQWKRRLDWLRAREEKLQGSVDGLDLEYALQRIADLAGARDRHLFHGLAGYLSDVFDPDQRKEVFRLIDKIEQSIPWKGINWDEVFRALRNWGQT